MPATEHERQGAPLQKRARPRKRFPNPMLRGKENTAAGRVHPSYHGLPSTGERPGRKIPQVFESGITSKGDDYGLDGRTAVGHAGTKDHAEGGYGCVGGRNGLWNNANGTRNIRRAEQRPGHGRSPTTHAGHSGTTSAGTRRMAWHEGRSEYRGLQEAEYVFMRRDASHGPLQTPYTGPYRVIQRHGKYYVIQCGEREESVSVDRLKPANADPYRPIEPAILPRRGRPPNQREERQKARREQPETRPEQETETRPEQETEHRPPTYAQITRRGREVRPRTVI